MVPRIVQSHFEGEQLADFWAGCLWHLHSKPEHQDHRGSTSASESRDSASNSSLAQWLLVFTNLMSFTAAGCTTFRGAWFHHIGLDVWERSQDKLFMLQVESSAATGCKPYLVYETKIELSQLGHQQIKCDWITTLVTTHLETQLHCVEKQHHCHHPGQQRFQGVNLSTVNAAHTLSHTQV